MGKDAGFDTGVSTINPDIQELLSGRDYPPSHIARVINRSIEDKRYKAYKGLFGLRKGHFVEDNESFHVFPTANINIKSFGKELNYPSLTMPSFEGGAVVRELDSLVERFDPRALDEDAFYNLLAMIVVTIGSAHAFPDGTGRTAVGLVDVYLRKYLDKSLDREKLQALDNRLTSPMTVGSILMLPEEYNPNVVLGEMSRGDKRKVIIPRIGTHSTREVQQFARKYAESISEHVGGFNPDDMEIDSSVPFSLAKDSIMPIAALLRAVTVG